MALLLYDYQYVFNVQNFFSVYVFQFVDNSRGMSRVSNLHSYHGLFELQCLHGNNLLLKLLFPLFICFYYNSLG